MTTKSHPRTRGAIALTTKSHPRTRGAIALTAGAALLLGGSTFALWTAQSQVAGGNISSGSLDVLLSGGTWQDISPEHATPVAIPDLADFTVVPGDVLRGTFALDAAGLGDNFLAQIDLRLAGLSGDLLGIGDGVSISYEIFNAAGESVGTSIPGSTGSRVDVISADSTVVAPDAILVDAVADGTAPELSATVTATFDRNTAEQGRINAQAVLGNLTATLTQKRA